MKVRQVTAEVLYPDEAIVRVDQEMIGTLKSGALTNERKRMRLCAHPDASNALHEMIIALADGAWFPPHKHPGKSESFHMIEGRMDVVLFDDSGVIFQVVHLSTLGKGGNLIYRISDPIYHTILIQSPVVVYHETTNGPFNPADTVVAPWAPEVSDLYESEVYIQSLNEKIQTQPRNDQ